jgi:hypothetical protein
VARRKNAGSSFFLEEFDSHDLGVVGPGTLVVALCDNLVVRVQYHRPHLRIYPLGGTEQGKLKRAVHCRIELACHPALFLSAGQGREYGSAKHPEFFSHPDFTVGIGVSPIQPPGV